MGLEFRALVVGPLETNCYLIWDTSTHKAAIIDPGGDKQAITDTISSLGIEPEYILLTHGHPDHCFIAGDLARDFGARIAMHGEDIPIIADGLGIAELFYDVSSYVEFSPSVLLSDGDVIEFGESPVEVLHTPGHSPGGLCFVTSEGVFCGDTVFAGSIGRTDFPGGSYTQLINSIRTRILSLKDATPLYPGHGPSTTVGTERESNPFLQ